MSKMTRRKRLSLLFLIAAAIVLLYGAYLILAPFFEPIAAAIILTIAFYPLYDEIQRRMKSPSLASFVCVTLLTLVILLPLSLLGATVVNEARQVFVRFSQTTQDNGGWSSYVDQLTEKPAAWISEKTGMPAPNLKATVMGKADQIAASLLHWVTSAAGNLTTTAVDTAFTLFIMFFLFAEGTRYRARLSTYIPLEERRLNQLIEVTRVAIVNNLYGMVAVAAVQGVLTGIGFAIVGLASPVLWGTIATGASFLPVVGPALVWAPGVIYLAIVGSWWKCLILLIWGVAIVGSADNVLRPLILSRGSQLSTLTVFIALMGGVQAFGFLGLFAGPVILTLAQVVLKILHEERRDWEASDPRCVEDADAVPPAMHTLPG